MVQLEQALGGVAALVLVVLGVSLIYRGLGTLQNGWTIWQHDPIDAEAVRYENGIVEVQGTVEQLEAELLTTKYTDTPAVAHEYKRQEKTRRTGPDPEDEREWETVESGTESQPFYVTDETGTVAVDPDGATISLDTEKISGGTTVEIGAAAGSTDKQFEGSLEPEDHVHVYGQKRDARGETLGDEQFYIGDGGEGETFSISDTTEFRTSLRYLGKGLLWVVLGLAALGASGVLSLVLLGRIEIAEYMFVFLLSGL